MTSSSKPEAGGRLAALNSDLRRAARLDRRTWRDLLRATFELAIARIRLGTRDTGELLGKAQAPETGTAAPLPDADRDALLDRVAFAVPRMGPRVPWRADCLVQALAAQRWLGRHGVPTAVRLGVHKGEPSRIDAHAWLLAGDRIVTGGDVGGYSPFVTRTGA